jgi:hypothetical protein
MAPEEVRRAYAGFYCPFVWRIYDRPPRRVVSLGPANWALILVWRACSASRSSSREARPVTIRRRAVSVRIRASRQLPPVTVYWEDNGGDAIFRGMMPSRRQIPGIVGRAYARHEPSTADGSAGTISYSSARKAIWVRADGRRRWLLLLRWADYKLPNAYLARSPGPSAGASPANWNISAHARDWIRACKGGEPACSNFATPGLRFGFLARRLHQDAYRTTPGCSSPTISHYGSAHLRKVEIKL